MNLPHAARVATRVREVIERHPRYDDAGPGFGDEVDDELAAIERLLWPIAEADENPPRGEAEAVAERLAGHGRKLVDVLEKHGVKSDRLGQCVRNFFECLERGAEGAELGLRAGEEPGSVQRAG